MMSSVRPSAKNSCSDSPLIFANGRTAIAGLWAGLLASKGDSAGAGSAPGGLGGGGGSALAPCEARLHGGGRRAGKDDAKGADRPRDVLESLLAKILKAEVKP